MFVGPDACLSHIQSSVAWLYKEPMHSEYRSLIKLQNVPVSELQKFYTNSYE